MGNRTYVLMVSLEQVSLYQEHGWEFIDISKENSGLSRVKKTVHSHEPFDQLVNAKNGDKPWLIQRASIRRPLGKFKRQGLSASLNFDYMGSSEFEHDNLPDSLLRVHSTFFDYQLQKSDEIYIHSAGKTFCLRLFTRLKGLQLAQYFEYIKQLRKGTLQLKEFSRFDGYAFSDSSLPTQTDFWWDVDNDVFFSFDKTYLSELPSQLLQSFSNMGLSPLKEKTNDQEKVKIVS